MSIVSEEAALGSSLLIKSAINSLWENHTQISQFAFDRLLFVTRLLSEGHKVARVK